MGFFNTIRITRVPSAILALYSRTPSVAPADRHHQDAGGIIRREEAVLLARLSKDHSFPCSSGGGDSGSGAATAAAVLPLLAEQLGLDKDDVGSWGAVEEVFGRAYPWAVSLACTRFRCE